MGMKCCWKIKMFTDKRSMAMQWILSILLVVLEAHLSQTQDANTIQNNECEVTLASGIVQYFACASQPILLFNAQNFTVTTSPEAYTCGTPRSEYCTLGIQECLECDAADPAISHPPEAMVDRNVDGSENIDTWWQSITWDPLSYPEPLAINITLSFNKLYELSDDFIITFKSVRPPEMIIEKSSDYGLTWVPWEYYSKRCSSYFSQGVMPVIPAGEPDAVTCKQEYTDETPYQLGTVSFDVTEDRFRLFLGQYFTNYQNLYQAFNQTNLNSFLSFTDIRLRLLKPATDGKEPSRAPVDFLKYYYGIANIDLTAACSCNLHGKFCVLGPEGNTICECAHNTDGDNCERCLPLFNNRPWKPGYYLPYPEGTANECQGCECNDHADSCTYDGDLRRGVCDNCTHDTTGLSCERCAEGYFPNVTEPINSPFRCTACDCEPLGVVNNITSCTSDTGQCFCQSFTQGRRCDSCRDGKYGLLLMDNQPGDCKDCFCVSDGTVGGSNICDRDSGQCPCKPNVDGRDCSRCKEGFFAFPSGRPTGDCIDCACDAGGSVSLICNASTAQCTCRDNIQLQHCNQTKDGFYAPGLDALDFQPRMTAAPTECPLDTDLLSSEDPFSGRVFSVCTIGGQTVEFEPITGIQPQPTVVWQYRPTIRYSLNSTEPWTSATLRMVMTGDSGIDLTVYRSRSPEESIPNTCNPGAVFPNIEEVEFTTLNPGNGVSIISPNNVSLDARCTYSLTLTVGAPGLTNTSIKIDSIVMLPDHNSSLVWQVADASEQAYYEDCEQRIASVVSQELALTEYPCRKYTFATTTELSMGGLPCDCDPEGSLAGTYCERVGGQCRCKPGVYGRRCDICAPGFYNKTDTGCVPCECDLLGSANLVCDYTTGQCPCHLNVATANQPNVIGLVNDLRCRSCIPDYFGVESGQGCSPCDCDITGRNQSQCDELGQCVCMETIAGEKCDRCQDGYYLFSEQGCSLCNCSEAGSESINCDAQTGQCVCKQNVQGDKCDICQDYAFNLQRSNPDGCQRCFCYGHSTTCTSAQGYSAYVIEEENALNWPLVDALDTGVQTHAAAPVRYLGNRMSSYGQFLSLLIQTRGGATIEYQDQQAIILRGNDEQVYLNSSMYTATSVYSELRVQLHHEYWLYNATRQADYFRFYAILADLTGVFIQRRFGDHTVDVMSISLVSSQRALPGQQEVTYVEQCTCEAGRNVAGLSCEDCAQGFRRPTVNDTSYEVCQPCDCNDRTLTDPPECDQQTGLCLNCKNGTVGDTCENCAESVVNCEVCTADTCGICVDEFYGLSKNGCLPCSCDAVGSVRPVCDKDTGQCECQPNVNSRQCDQCEDNFFDLTAAGCTECDECYGLVMDEMIMLRGMRTNLTRLVNDLESVDPSADIGSFSERLAETNTDMQWLLLYLSEAERIQSSTQQEIERLNLTLSTLADNLDTSALLGIQHAMDGVNLADAYTQQGHNATIDTTNKTIKANIILTGDTATPTIEALLTSIQAVQRAMADVSSTAIGDVMRVSSIVQSIQSGSTQSKQLADQAYLTAQGSQNIHRQTTNTLTQLEAYIILVSSIKDQAGLSSSYAFGNASRSLDQANFVMNNATNMEPIPDDITAMENRATLLRSEADTLALQASQAQDTAQEIVTLVQSARQRTDDLVNQVNQRESTANLLQSRIEQAYRQALGAQSLANQSFTDATRMLTIMSNFNAEAAAVEAEANRSLAAVQDIQASGEQSIDEAMRLQEELVIPVQNSQTAFDIAQTAVNDSSDILQDFTPVHVSATALSNYSQTVLTDINTYPDIVITVNSTIVRPGDETCNVYLDQNTLLETKSITAAGSATNASQKVSSTTQRVNTILQNFQNIDSISTAGITELRALIQNTRATFDKTLLASSVTNLKTAMEQQRQEVDNMKARRDQLQAQIRRLRNIQEQLRTGAK